MLGEKGCGKTALFYRLKEAGKVSVGGVERGGSKGLDVAEADLRDLRFICFDLDGSESYRFTHQVCICLCIYIFVWNVFYT